MGSQPKNQLIWEWICWAKCELITVLQTRVANSQGRAGGTEERRAVRSVILVSVHTTTVALLRARTSVWCVQLALDGLTNHAVDDPSSGPVKRICMTPFSHHVNICWSQSVNVYSSLFNICKEYVLWSCVIRVVNVYRVLKCKYLSVIRYDSNATRM